MDKGKIMCRNIKPLFNFEPPVTEDEIREAALQYVRKISGFTRPSKANEKAFYEAVNAIMAASSALVTALKTDAPPRIRTVVRSRAAILQGANK
jgi:hypothetical protein